MNKNILILILIIELFASNSLFANNQCYKLFKNTDLLINQTISSTGKKITEPAEESLDKLDSTSRPFKNFLKLDNKLKKQISALKLDEQKSLKQIIDALYFFDYEHIGFDFISTFNHPTKDYKTIKLSTRYDSPKNSKNFSIFDTIINKFFNKEDKANSQKNNTPFLNFQDAVTFIKDNKPEADIKSLKMIQSIMMRNTVENGQIVETGKFRGKDEYGNVTHEKLAINEVEKETINSNIYLSFFINGQTNENLYSGQIYYASVEHPKATLVDRFKGYDSILGKKWEAYLKNRETVAPNKRQQFYSDIIESLVAERLANYNLLRLQLGNTLNKDNTFKVIELIADLYSDMIAIHPFTDGNGRSIRAFTNLLLAKEGLPPALILNPWLDIQVNKAEWRKIFISGVKATYNLLLDLSRRIDLELPIENSPYLLYPFLPNFSKIKLISYNSRNNLNENRNARIDSGQFSAFVKEKLNQDPNLLVEIKNNTLKKMSELVEEFIKFFQAKTIDYIHNKEGLQEVSIKFVDPDFIEKFGVPVANKLNLWIGKVQRYYKSKQLVWRGLAQLNYEFTDADLVAHFKTFQKHLLSNRVASIKTESQEKIRLQVVEDFQRFNKELLAGDYTSIVYDHATTGPKYAESYGLSSSKKESVGKSFAMGAMVIAAYGKHNTPEMQQKLKSRINIAFYRADKDIDLNRLHQIEPSYLNMYPRQAEVMAVGGVDPDIVMNIQRLGPDGKVINTFARDPENPNKVYLIEGRWVQGEEPLPTDRILNSWDLF